MVKSQGVAGASARRQYRREARSSAMRLAVALLCVAGAAALLLGMGGMAPVVVGAGLAALAVVVWPRRRPERWLRGAEGEQRTAVLLDRLPARRWVVLHDRRVPGSRANIDHVVIGPTGVWVVDTKVSRAAVSSSWRRVWLGAHALDIRPLQWSAAVVADRLCDWDGAGVRKVPVRPLVVVHSSAGPGLPRRGRRVAGIRVVPADGLLRRLRRGRRRIRAPDVARMAALVEDVLPPAT